MIELAIAIIISIVITLIFAVCLRLKKSIYILLALLITPIVSLILINPKFAMITWHEFMHASIVFNIINGVVPPEDVLLAGYPLKYPWFHHYLVALVCQMANIAPPMGFAILNILSLIISAITIFKTAQLLSPTAETGIFAVFLSIFGTSIFFLKILTNFGIGLALDERALPLHKFAHANSNPLGFCFFFVCLFFLMRLFSHREKPYINSLGIIFSITATGLLYPICWLAISITCICVSIGQGIAKKGKNWQSILIVLLALFFGSGLALPYILNVSKGRAKTAEMSLNFAVQHRLIALFLLLILPLLILWLQRHKVKILLNSHSSEVLTLICTGIGLGLLYIFVTIPLSCQYKFMMLLIGVIGILIAPFFTHLDYNKPLFTKPIIAALFLPTVLMFASMFTQVQVADRVHTSGIAIRHDDTQMDKLYTWIATNTPVNTVVIDSFRTVPVLSRRSLYISNDLRRQQDPTMPEYDGWFINTKTISAEVYGQNREIVERRLQNAIALLTPNSKEIINAAAKNVKQELPNRPVIVIVRDQNVQPAFDDNLHFSKIFAEPSVWVYRLEKI